MTAGHTKQDDAQFEGGERCLICYERTAEPYGRPGACEDCGGDFVLEKNTDDYKMRAMADELKDRALTEDEKALHDSIKEKAVEMEQLFLKVKPGRYNSLAITDLEKSVMWIIKELTA